MILAGDADLAADDIAAVLRSVPFDVWELAKRIVCFGVHVHEGRGRTNVLGMQTVLVVPPSLKVPFIVLTPLFFEAGESLRRHVVAHELAHHWLRHPQAADERTRERQEREAEAVAAEWGFPRPD